MDSFAFKIINAFKVVNPQEFVMTACAGVGLLGYAVYKYVAKKAKRKPLKIVKRNDDTSFSKSQLDVISKRANYRRVNSSFMNMSRDQKRKKAYMYNKFMKKVQSQQDKLSKNDQVFYEIMKKFSYFVARKKLAVA